MSRFQGVLAKVGVHLLSSALIVVAVLAANMTAPQPLSAQSEGSSEYCTTAALGCAVSKANIGGEKLAHIATPTLPTIVVAPPPPKPASKTVSYVVETRGTITASLAEFKSQSSATLNDARGWARMGVSFQEVGSGGNFTLVLSEASQVPSFSPSVCDSTYSCRVGRYVIINQDRWLGATQAWNDGGGNLRDYRHMVINHETGHWLGHGHEYCKAAGQPAAVMQQQSINLQGCTFNPWPLASELWSTTLGI